MSDRPALLGNPPLFTEKVRFGKPDLPAFDEVAEEIRELLHSGHVTKGKHLQLLEDELASHLGVTYAVAVSSCTAGLMLTHQALNVQRAVLPAFTFMATASSLVWAGVRPVFADVDRRTMNLDVDSVDRALDPATDTIVATHNFGNPAAISQLETFAARRGLRLIFDAAHGMGTQFRGRPVGAQGDAQVFSLSATKLVVAGEGGVIATNDAEVAEKVRKGRDYGNDGNYNSEFAGINARMPELSALLARHSLRRLDESVDQRNKIAAVYREELRDLAGIGFQEIESAHRSSYTYFAITVGSNDFGLSCDELAAALGAENIDTRKYYDPPAHRHTAYREFAVTADCPAADYLAAHVLCLPIWSGMQTATAARIAHAIKRIQTHSREVSSCLQGKLTVACV